jgi:MFS family permease
LPILGQFRLLTLHSALFGLSSAMAGGFVGGYLLKLGLSLPMALVAYALLLLVRFAMRFLALEVVRKLGLTGAMKLGAVIASFQFLPLLLAEDVRWLGAWILIVSVAEALYWPVYHASSAATVAEGSGLGRQVGERLTIGALIAVIGPLLGGLLLSTLGESVDFAIAAAVCLLSVWPISRMAPVAAGPIPTARETLRNIDLRGMATFAADGWIASGLTLAWPMVLFSSVSGSYGAFALANAGAGLAGAAVSFFCGRAIDHGRRDRYLLGVCVILAAGFALRIASAWSPLAAAIANMTGAVAAGFYGPVVMSTVYERARRSGTAFKFHFSLEGGWDFGAVTGCMAAAAMAWWTATPAFAVLPASLGIAAIYLCVRAPARDASLMDLATVPGGGNAMPAGAMA